MFPQKLINNDVPSGLPIIRSRVSCNSGVQPKAYDLIFMIPLAFGGLVKTSTDYSLIAVKFLSPFIGLHLPACPYPCTASPVHDS
jgi:hypothetical protein